MELIEYAVVRRRLSTLSNDTSSETTRPIRPKLYLYLLHSWASGLNVCIFAENWLFSLVAMAIDLQWGLAGCFFWT